MTQHTLDLRGMMCPIPVIRTQNKVKELAEGDTLELLCTDPGTLSDIPAWCRIHGHELVSTEQSADQITIIVRAGPRN